MDDELLAEPPADGCYLVREYPIRRRIGISETLFADLRVAEGVVHGLRVIEEDFDVLLGNYTEYEATVLGLGATSMAGIKRSLETEDQNRRLCGRRIANLLTAARSFIDHTSHNASAIAGKGSPSHTTIVEAFRAAYDARLGYRAMEALRNYAQHRGAAVHGVRYGSMAGPNEAATYIVSPDLNLSDLMADKAFKSTVAAELQTVFHDDPGHIPLTPLVRDYVAGLGDVMGSVRLTFSEALLAAENANETAIDVFLASAGSLTHDGISAAQYYAGSVVATAKVDRLERARIAGLCRLNRIQRKLATSLIRG